MNNFLNDKKMKIALSVIVIAAMAIIGVLALGSGEPEESNTELTTVSVEGNDASDIEDVEVNPDSQNSVSEESAATTENVVLDNEDEVIIEDAAVRDEVSLTFRYDNQLDSHYEKHGIDMGFASAEEYLEAANAVINNPKALHKIEAEDGDDVYYVEETNEFVVVSTDGYIRTYFLPDDGLDYYNRQ